MMIRACVVVFPAWVQVNGGNAAVIALFKTSGGFVHAGAVEAQSGCWSMLKGGLTAESTGAAKIYFEVTELFPLRLCASFEALQI